MKFWMAPGAGLLAATPLLAGSLPGMRGVDHIGLTVPNLVEVEEFFFDVLSCEKATSFGPFRVDAGSFMQDFLDVNPRAVIEQITLMHCGFGSNTGLFKYTAPDQKEVRPRNSDIGGHHIAIYVDDVNAAAEYLKGENIHTLLGPLPVNEGAAGGRTLLYFYAPWGLQMEAISYPDGMTYEKDSGPVLWSSRATSE